MSAREHDDLTDDPGEVVDALPVAGDDGPFEPRRAPAATPMAPLAARHEEPAAAPVRSVPVAQAAAVAATGFAAGAVTAAVVRTVSKRRRVKGAAKRGGRHGLPVAGSRSFLVDVHLLGPKE